MNITYKWGFYIGDKLVIIDARLNTNQDYYRELKSLLKVESLKDYVLKRVGGSAVDGHYLMIKNFKKNQIAYSFGINNDVSWDEVMAGEGCLLYMYDHTIPGLPYERNGFNYFKEGIAGESAPEKSLNTLEHYIKRNGHANKNSMILKMDVEGAEWDFLASVQPKTLRQFDQIIFELHNLVRACSDEEMEKKLNGLRKLNRTHQLVHLHANNTAYVLQMNGHTIPDVVEVTYVNKEKYDTFVPNELILPTPDDLANDKNREDIFLGNWNIPFDENPCDFSL